MDVSGIHLSIDVHKEQRKNGMKPVDYSLPLVLPVFPYHGLLRKGREQKFYLMPKQRFTMSPVYTDLKQKVDCVMCRRLCHAIPILICVPAPMAFQIVFSISYHRTFAFAVP